MSSEVACRQLGFRVTAVRDGIARVVAAIGKERPSASSKTADSARTRS
jgi:hypothetical protein